MLKLPQPIKDILFPDILFSLNTILFIFFYYSNLHSFYYIHFLGSTIIWYFQISFLVIFISLIVKHRSSTSQKSVSMIDKLVNKTYFLLILSLPILTLATIFVSILGVLLPEIIYQAFTLFSILQIAFLIVTASTVLVPIYKCIRYYFSNQSKL
jgi:hypothetical protein